MLVIAAAARLILPCPKRLVEEREVVPASKVRPVDRIAVGRIAVRVAGPCAADEDLKQLLVICLDRFCEDVVRVDCHPGSVVPEVRIGERADDLDALAAREEGDDVLARWLAVSFADRNSSA